MASADDDVSRHEVGPKLPGDGAADESNARAEGPDVDLPETGPEDFHRAGRWPQPGACDLQQRGLAGPVRPEDNPAVFGGNAPVDPPQHGTPFRCSVTPCNEMAAGDPGAVTPACRLPRRRGVG